MKEEYEIIDGYKRLCNGQCLKDNKIPNNDMHLAKYVKGDKSKFWICDCKWKHTLPYDEPENRAPKTKEN